MNDKPKLGKQRPLYLDIAETLMTDVTEGKYEVGQSLPTEEELCRQFGVSRSTVRQALSALQSAGLVQRRQGSGTKVINAHQTMRFVLSVKSEIDVLQYESETFLDLKVEAERVPTADGRRLRLAHHEEWLRWHGVRRMVGDGLPLGLVTIYLSKEYAEDLYSMSPQEQADFFGFLTQRSDMKVTRLDQEMLAIALDSDEAEELEADPGTPALSILRRYWSGRDLLEVSETIHPSNRFSYRLRLDRDT